MVFTRRSARQPPRRERRGIPASRFAPKKMAPRVASSAPNRAWNQKATKLCTTKPPAKASSAKRDESRRTTRRDPCSPSPGSRNDGLWSLRPDGGVLDRRAEPGEEEQQRRSQHRVAQDHGRLAESAVAPLDWSVCERNPPASDPSAVAKELASAYQEKTRVRSSAGRVWASAACSMARKGPTSFPAGLILPRWRRGGAPRTTWSRRRGGRPPPSWPRPGEHPAPPDPVGVGGDQSESAVSPSRVSESSSPMRPSESPASER